jgi:hypothetical protein
MEEALVASMKFDPPRSGSKVKDGIGLFFTGT